MLTPKSLQDYRTRWEAVAEVEAHEQRETPILIRWRQINSLLRLALDLKLVF
ncbi:MAG: hypothetical protein JXA21_23620 [Anaerolineae bacterium]|nr:hypothetical protein [Anaerolineae bacterium]